VRRQSARLRAGLESREASFDARRPVRVIPGEPWLCGDEMKYHDLSREKAIIHILASIIGAGQ